MIKTIYQGDQDELLVQCAGQMSNLIRTDSLYKQAASSCFPQDVIAQNAPDKDHFMLHVVALGAHPRYLPNRNGDAFTREDLINTHDTFVKFAKFYREHRNTDPDNNLGLVKASAYNHDLDRVELLVHGHKQKAEEEYELAKKGSELSVSMSCKVRADKCSCCANEASNLAHYCFLPDTLITMADGTLRPIVDIEEGDVVLSSEGLPTKVTHLFFREVNETIKNVRTSINGQTIRVTGNHPFLALPYECGHMLGFRNTLLDNPNINRTPTNKRKGWESLLPNPIFIAVENLANRDFVFAPVKKFSEVPWDGFCDEEEAWVFGLFVAEGSFGKLPGGELRSVQFSLHEKETDYVEKLQSYFLSKHDKVAYVYTVKNSKGISVRVHNCKIAEMFRDICGEYVYGKKIDDRFFSAPDPIKEAFLKGIYDGDGHVYNTTSDSQKSYSRINSAGQNLVNQLWHLTASLGHCNYTNSFINMGGPSNRTNKLPAWYLNSSFQGSPGVISGSNDRFENYTVGYVKNISDEHYAGPVYNFETEDHTYVAEGLAVHNCDHLKDNMNQYMPEFRKYAFAYNPNPKFFDISRVRRPADRIAHYLEYVFGDEQDSLQKAASAVSKGGIVIPGAAWAKYQGFEQEDYSLPDNIEKLASQLSDKELWYEAMAHNPEKGSPEYAYANLVKKASVSAQELPKQLEELVPSIFFRKQAKAGVVMPFDMFVSYIEGRSLGDVRQDPDFQKTASQLPLLFTNFLKEATVTDMNELLQTFKPASESATSASTRNPDEIDDLMQEMEQKHSCCLNAVYGRSLGESSCKDHDPRHTHCPDTAGCQLDKLASAYACYQLQILSNMSFGDAELIGVTGNNRFSVKKD